MGEKKKQEKAEKASENSKEAELKESLQRLQADFENYVKRAEKEAGNAKEKGEAGAVLKVLPLIDAIESSLANAEKAGSISKEEAVKGLEALAKQARAVLQEMEVEKIDCLGGKFDSGKCDAIASGSEKGKKEGEVLEEIQRGYTFKGKMLRHAKVKVNKVGD